MRHILPWLLVLAPLTIALGCGETVEVGGGQATNDGDGGNNGVNNDGVGNDGVDNNGVVDDGEDPVPDCQGCEGCVGGFEDGDGDGFGERAVCVPASEAATLAPAGGDCSPDDPTRNPGAAGICGDYVDDDCDGEDEACPTTQSSGVSAPTWRCEGTPPANVLAWARFGDGGGYVADGLCFVIFEGLPGEFYVAPQGLTFVNPRYTCPTPGGGVGYDERMYAHVVRSPETCPPLPLIVHGPNEDAQAVSTECRRFLHHMTSTAPHTYIGSGLDEVRARLERFSTVEVSCSEYQGWTEYRHALLLSGELSFNADFQGN